MIEYLLFLVMGLYTLTSALFLFLFLRTLRSRDGIGLLFLKILTFGIFIGSTTIAISRFCALYVHDFDPNFGRILAIVNPVTLFGVGLYLNYLFHRKNTTITGKTSQNIKDIKKDVKEVKRDVKDVQKTLGKEK